MELEWKRNEWGMANGNMRNGSRGFDDGAFLGWFYFFRSLHVLPAFAVAFSLMPAGGRLWVGDGLLLPWERRVKASHAPYSVLTKT